MVTITVEGSLTVTSLIGSRAPPATASLRRVSMLSLTAAPSSGVPSWKVMPGRRVIVHTVPSALGVTDWAR